MNPVIRIATRRSPLALWQAEHVAERLVREHPGLRTELLPITTRGDKLLDAPLAKVGGKGLFVKELEHCLIDGRADIAVHSMKDVPVDLPDELHVATIMERADPHDAFVSERFAQMDELPAQAMIGTSSLRRQCQLRARFPDFAWLDLRGNVNTRLQKLGSGECDAVILAAAGLKRLGLEHVIAQILPPDLSLPAIGQGALGIECRREDARMHELLAPLHHHETAICVAAERAVNQRLQGGCQVPIAGYAMLRDGGVWLRALVASPDGTAVLRAQSTGSLNEAEALGLTVAEDLLSQGAADILRAAGFE